MDSHQVGPPAIVNGAADNAGGRPNGITTRAVMLGVLLAALNAFWVTMAEVRFYSMDGSSLPLFITPVFMLLVLVGINGLVARFAPRRVFKQEEMLTAYIMAVISNTFAGHDMLQNFFGQLTHPYYFAPQNQWQDVFIDRLPKGLFVSDPDALSAWYRGNTPPGQAMGYFVHWAVPLTLWGSFFLVLVFLFWCVTALVKRAWAETERLAFPIIQLPLAITAPEGGLFRNPRMWGGFAFAFILGLINGLHELYPQVPHLEYVKLFDLGQYFTNQPLAAIKDYGMQGSLYPFAIGLAYFIPLDLAFSCWFSYLFARGYFVFGRASGLDGPSAAQGWPFLKEISSGAWIGVAGAILWANRKHFARAFDLAFERDKAARKLQAENPQESRQMRFAFTGLAVSFVLLLLFAYFLLSLSPLIATGFFLILLALSLGITRVRAEFGTPHEIVFVKPGDMLVTLFGTKAIGDTNLIGMQSMYWFNRGYRCHPMPNFLEGYKMAENKAMPFNRLTGVYALAAVVSLFATFASIYFVTYEAGGAGKAIGYKRWVGQEAFTQLNSWLTTGQRAGSTNLWFFAGGLVIVGVLAYLRGVFIWWPLHPAGFALGISYAMNYFWMPVMVAWLAKLLIIRYGGMNAHKRAIPFFLGLILGDYTVGALWSLLSLALGVPTYKVYI